jgi:hypothetical protein
VIDARRELHGVDRKLDVQTNSLVALVTTV